jgi:protein-S-isoprenylcysteine O-methyltransferase Ste14
VQVRPRIFNPGINVEGVRDIKSIDLDGKDNISPQEYFVKREMEIFANVDEFFRNSTKYIRYLYYIGTFYLFDRYIVKKQETKEGRKYMNDKNWKKFILPCIWGPLLVGQIILVFVFKVFSEARLNIAMHVGWIIWWIAVIFACAPIFIFKKRGGVPKGKSFVHTTLLVNSGLYSIVRHPQYEAGILFNLALILISQNWLIATMGVAVILLLYVDILMADKYEIEKFGDEYKRYMEKVRDILSPLKKQASILQARIGFPYVHPCI